MRRRCTSAVICVFSGDCDPATSELLLELVFGSGRGPRLTCPDEIDEVEELVFCRPVFEGCVVGARAERRSDMAVVESESIISRDEGLRQSFHGRDSKKIYSDGSRDVGARGETSARNVALSGNEQDGVLDSRI